MSLLTDLPIQFTVDAVAYQLKVESKKRLLERISEFAAFAYHLDADLIYEHLLTRERMGATGLGDGLAIPHCRLAEVVIPTMVFATLAAPIDYDAEDDKPVDIVWALLVPTHANAQHLQVLAAIAHFLKQANLTQALREAPDAMTVYQLIEANLCLPS